ncbi:hypothetical protein DFH08DRAFT_891539 [Mycena albidolilacea]|uniref:Probable RNA-binding protein 18 n=1 Tax=Mycena albidolilacea TaxID=1033008 RepID=A0AAD7EF80_9AGAR|nr:hypothetical protein DFH08DRAFT_891539 [Mycena albidolilacea]
MATVDATMDDTAQADSLDHYLSHPTYSEETLPEGSTSKVPVQSRQLLQDRLYIGNLHPTVDEYSLLQIFSKFGKVTKLDFLFHKTGLLKGKPRGYAFVEYGSKDDALKALGTAHNKLLRGRKLVVTFAQQAPVDPGAGSMGSRNRKVMTDSGRPTTLSMIKSGLGNRNEGTRDKIAMMEAKLRQMEKSKPTPNSDAPSLSSLPYHPSLPAKPLPSDVQGPSQLGNGRSSNEPQRQPQRKPPPPLPSLPLFPQASAESKGLRGLSGGSKPSTTTRKASGLVGVKLGKPKEKDKSTVAPKEGGPSTVQESQANVTI